MKDKIKTAIVGVGNCASSLIQGIQYYENCGHSIGLMNKDIGGYLPSDIEVVAAFDIDNRKVGQKVSEAIFAKPNNTKNLVNSMRPIDIFVEMGAILDGCAKHTSHYPRDKRIVPCSGPEPDGVHIVSVLRKSKAEVLLNYLPVGSDAATKFYMNCALEAGVAVINNIPIFIASDTDWEKKFKDKGIPIIGDDIKSQLGATIVHRTLTDLFKNRGVILDRTYQLNIGGNTDFLNMLDMNRLKFKKISKTESVRSSSGNILDDDNIHIGPSDYVPWQKDNKVCFIRMEGRIFGDIDINLELRLSVEDSPNSAGVVIDAIRCCKIALEQNIGGALIAPSSYFMKHPPKQFTDTEALRLTKTFILEKKDAK